MNGLEDVKPIYSKDTIVYFDRYGDGNPYENKAYIAHFRTVLQALRERRWLRIYFDGRDGISHCWNCVRKRAISFPVWFSGMWQAKHSSSPSR